MLSYTHLNKTQTVQFKGGLERLHVLSAIENAALIVVWYSFS